MNKNIFEEALQKKKSREKFDLNDPLVKHMHKSVRSQYRGIFDDNGVT